MKRTKNLVILLIVLALAVGAYIAASLLTKREEEKDTQTEETKITLANKKAEDITSVSIVNTSGSYTVELLSNKYFLKDDHTFPLDPKKAKSIVNAASVIECSRIVTEEGGNEGDYGLDKPKYLISISYSDGAKLSLKIGDYNQHTSSNYLSLEGENKVYMIDGDFAPCFGIPMNDLIQNEVLSQPENRFDCLSEISISFADGGGHKYSFIEEDNEDKEDSWGLTLSDGRAVPGDFTDKAEAIYNQIFELSLTNWVEYNLTEESELQKYGLSAPYATITVVYNDTVVISGENTGTVTKLVEKKIILLLGDVLPDSESEDEREEESSEAPESTLGEQTEEKTTERYFKLGDGKIVYIVPEDSFSEILTPAEGK